MSDLGDLGNDTSLDIFMLDQQGSFVEEFNSAIKPYISKLKKYESSKHTSKCKIRYHQILNPFYSSSMISLRLT